MWLWRGRVEEMRQFVACAAPEECSDDRGASLIACDEAPSLAGLAGYYVKFISLGVGAFPWPNVSFAQDGVVVGLVRWNR